MSRRNVVTFLTAPARSGKSFRIVVRICDEILPLTTGNIYTNLPLYPEKIAQYCVEKHGMDYDTVLSRIHIIPRTVELDWRNAGKPIYDEKGKKIGAHPFEGPWNYFNELPLSGSTIIIDEIHNFCGSIGTPKPIANNWHAWLGELGHNQAVFICISQSPSKVHTCIQHEAQASYTIRNTGLDRDPYFKIEVYDWLDLKCGLLGGSYRVFVFEQEAQRVEGRRQKGQRTLTLMGPPYFDFYDSFNKPIASDQTENVNPFEHEYEKHLRKGPIRGRISLIRWFVFKNFQALATRMLYTVLLGGVLLYLMTGGLGQITQYISAGMASSFKPKQKSESQESKPAENTKIESIASEITNPTDKTKLETIRQVYEEELRKSLTEKEAAVTEKEKLDAEVEKLKEEIERHSILTLVTPETVVFKGGRSYEVGEEIATGKYQGRRLDKINYRVREAVLDDGTLLYLGY